MCWRLQNIFLFSNGCEIIFRWHKKLKRPFVAAALLQATKQVVNHHHQKQQSRYERHKEILQLILQFNFGWFSVLRSRNFLDVVGPQVSSLVLYSDDLSSNPTDAWNE